MGKAASWARILSASKGTIQYQKTALWNGEFEGKITFNWKLNIIERTVRTIFWLNYNKNKNFISVSRLFFSRGNNCNETECVQCDMRRSKTKSKDVWRLKLNEGVRNSQELSSNNDALVELNGRRGKEDGDKDCS